VVVARNLGGVALHEIVLVGPRKWLGEVIKLEGGTATIQVYENTCTSDFLLSSNGWVLTLQFFKRD